MRFDRPYFVIGSTAIALSSLVAVRAAQNPTPAATPQTPAVTLPTPTGPVTAQPSKVPGNRWRPARRATAKSPALTAATEMRTFSMPPGFHAQLVASEPLVVDPIAIDFDEDGRLWVLETPAFMPDTSGHDSRDPINRIVVLEDTNGDGVMDKRTVFCDGLVLPRSLKVLDHGQVLVGEPPNLWLMTDTNGDLKVDTKVKIADDFGNASGNIEHNANSLYWAMDNWIYTGEATWLLRWKDGKFEKQDTPSRGQWGVSQDDAGRIFRNVNDEPLYVDYTPGQYFARNPAVVRTRGLYELLIEQMDATIYPVRSNRGVNRGYRDQFLRADGSSIIIQGAGTPTVYRGDKLPNLEGDAFITDSPTNLVHGFKITDDADGKVTAKNLYDRGEIMASSDERFRPVNLANAPDGSLYVVDMYRGVVQDGAFWSDYLRGYIKSHDLEMPVHYGRIWRIVYGNGRLDPKPHLSTATPAELVQDLSNPNGWWRDTAQQLLIQRNETSVAPELKTLAATAPESRVKLHALWTLDGLGAIDTASVEKALTDASPDVRAAAVRISERWLGEPGAPITASVLKLVNDPNWNVRRQLAASIGALPEAARIEPAAELLAANGTDAIIVNAALSGLQGDENTVLERVLQASVAKPPTDAVTMLAAAIAKSGDAAKVQQVVNVITDASRPEWQRSALIEGLSAGLPAPAFGGRFGRGGGLPGIGGAGSAQIVITPGRGVTLPAEPVALTKLADGSDSVATLAKTLVDKLEWTGKPQPVRPPVTPLTPEEQARFEAGQTIFLGLCAGCHQPDGQGKPNVAPSLVTSQFAAAANAQVPMRIVLEGKEGTVGLMPPLGPALTDTQIADVLTYVRRSWGHTASAVTPTEVTELRQTTSDRKTPWTNDELTALLAGRGGRGGRGGARGGRGAGAPGAGGGRGR